MKELVKKEIEKIIDWNKISKQELSLDFIREFKDKVDWKRISYHQKLSENFIREFKDKVYWYYISWRQILSEDFIREFQDKVNWDWIAKYQKSLSLNFVLEFKDKLHWGDMEKFQNMTREDIEKLELQKILEETNKTKVKNKFELIRF